MSSSNKNDPIKEFKNDFNVKLVDSNESLHDLEGDTPTISFTHNFNAQNYLNLVQAQDQIRKNTTDESEIEVFNINQQSSSHYGMATTTQHDVSSMTCGQMKDD